LQALLLTLACALANGIFPCRAKLLGRREEMKMSCCLDGPDKKYAEQPGKDSSAIITEIKGLAMARQW